MSIHYETIEELEADYEEVGAMNTTNLLERLLHKLANKLSNHSQDYSEKWHELSEE